MTPLELVLAFLLHTYLLIQKALVSFTEQFKRYFKAELQEALHMLKGI